MSRLPVCRIAAVAVSCLSAAPGIPASAGDTGNWRVVEISAPGAVAEIVQAGASAAIRIGRTWYRGATCPAGFCLAVSSAPPRQRPLRGGLPDGWIARAPEPGIVEAWYDEPTGRYDHAILGDAVEAGALVAIRSIGSIAAPRSPSMASPADWSERHLPPVSRTMRSARARSACRRSSTWMATAARISPCPTPAAAPW
jgi:hypothetical protein